MGALAKIPQMILGNITNGIGGAIKTVTGLATLDLKKAAEGVSQVVGGAPAPQEEKTLPAARASNRLIDQQVRKFVPTEEVRQA